MNVTVSLPGSHDILSIKIPPGTGSTNEFGSSSACSFYLPHAWKQWFDILGGVSDGPF
jgi:hypothetical protein